MECRLLVEEHFHCIKKTKRFIFRRGGEDIFFFFNFSCKVENFLIFMKIQKVQKVQRVQKVQKVQKVQRVLRLHFLTVFVGL